MSKIISVVDIIPPSTQTKLNNMEGGEEETSFQSHVIIQKLERNLGCYRGDVVAETGKQFRLALPLIAVNILQYCSQIISLMFVGHLGELPLSGASMATSFASVTGFSVLVSGFQSLLC